MLKIYHLSNFSGQKRLRKTHGIPLLSVSPGKGSGPTQGQRRTLNRKGFEPATFEIVTVVPPSELHDQNGRESWLERCCFTA